MKFKILPTTADGCGFYTGVSNVQWGSEVEAVYVNEKKNSIYVSGKEFIRIGGDVDAFKEEYSYMWGNFSIEDVEA